ncbi:MAG: HisA/HisF-related TIM barrel protein [Thermoplasmatota archaeon]
MRFVEPETPGDLQIIPSMAVMGATPVWVKDNRYNPLRIEGSNIPLVKLVSELGGRYEALHYLDIIGIRRGNVDWDAFRAAADRSEGIWADIGIIYSEGLIDVIMAGAQEVVVTTKMIDSFKEIVSSFELTENLVVQIDYDGSVVSKDRTMRGMTPSELVEELSSFGIEMFILDDIRENRDAVDRKFLESVMKTAPGEARIYAGIEDLKELEGLVDTGLAGAIVSCSKLLEGAE